jgi:hypothetical protein
MEMEPINFVLLFIGVIVGAAFATSGTVELLSKKKNLDKDLSGHELILQQMKINHRNQLSNIFIVNGLLWIYIAITIALLS